MDSNLRTHIILNVSFAPDTLNAPLYLLRNLIIRRMILSFVIYACPVLMFVLSDIYDFSTVLESRYFD